MSTAFESSPGPDLGPASPPPTLIPSAAEARAATPAGIRPSCGREGCACSGGASCTCGSGRGPTEAAPLDNRLVYALGSLGFDFISEARRDSVLQNIDTSQPLVLALIDYVSENPEVAEAVTWTLNADQTPIYAIRPTGAYAAKTYEAILAAFREGLDGNTLIVALGGTIAASTTLLSGQVVPVVIPAHRALVGWRREEMIARLTAADTPEERPRGRRREAPAPDEEGRGRYGDAIENYFNNVYYNMRNLGVSPQDRALNFSATNAWHASRVVEHATRRRLELDGITTRLSSICRPGSDCYDVSLKFYDADNTNRPVHTYLFTVDVSDVLPVLVGEVRTWSARS